ncbi:uncharacterized protein LOC112572916 [Pomacea canaliculata]|uniref:uncharacterized protein LOC112572916 n=1 Tax=Pomacea canaliculata TaxID=400727 RepID=UPI000D732DA8|nr:uncharacterized protein LOC112572916 [Pomacea canaliculata]
MRFSSRDTYAMHMLLRAKNEACVPTAPQRGNGSGKSDVPTTAGGSQITISPAAATVVSSSAAAVLGKQLPADPKQEETGDFPSLNGGSSLFGEPVRRKVSDPAFCLGLGLGLDAGRSVDYRGSWWSKYLPDGAEGVAIGSDAESPVTHLPLVCYLCGELFSNRDSLAMHVLFHTRDTPSTTHTSSTDGSSQWHKPLRQTPLPSEPRHVQWRPHQTPPATNQHRGNDSCCPRSRCIYIRFGFTSHISTSVSSMTSESLVRKVGGEACSTISGGEDERDGGGAFAEETSRRELPHVAGATPLLGAASKSSSVAVALDNQTPRSGEGQRQPPQRPANEATENTEG